jgi:hypothetical protein
MNEELTPSQQQVVARAFALAHLTECCAEIVEMLATAVLCEGRVRELAKLYKFAGDSSLDLAVSEVKTFAMQQVAGSGPVAQTAPGAESPEGREARIVAAIHASGATGRISLTYSDKNGTERPSNVCTTFLRNLAAPTV